jgi:hypothetical protein
MKPDNDPECQVSLETKLSHVKITEGESSEIFVKIRNVDAKQGQPMVVALVNFFNFLAEAFSRSVSLEVSNPVMNNYKN